MTTVNELDGRKAAMRVFMMALLVTWTPLSVRADEGAGGEGTAPGEHLPRMTDLSLFSVEDFGPIGNGSELQATYGKALEALTADKGGILFIPEDAPSATLENAARRSYAGDPGYLQDILNRWYYSPGVFVIDNRGGKMDLLVPSITGRSTGIGGGVRLQRSLRLKHGDSVPHAKKDPVLTIQNRVVHGTVSYRDVTELPAKAGADARLYVHNIRGIFEGMFLNASARVPEEGSKRITKVGRAIVVNRIGYDKEKKLHYFTTDTDVDWPAGTDLQNKTHNPSIFIENAYHTPNQTFDVYVRHKEYGNGDSYVIHGTLDYMGGVNSGGGDENAAVYTGYINGRCDSFLATVKSLDPPSHKLVFEQAQNANTLSSTRPLINLNPEKWTTAGKVLIVPAESQFEATDTGKYTYKGRTYPSSVNIDPKGGAMGLRNGLNFGGLIRGDADCPWDDSLVGRYFAIDEATECPRMRGKRRVRRWYEILEIRKNADNTKDMVVKRFWWGAKYAAGLKLYDPENYTYDGHEQPLSYVVAPGAYVYDVSEAVDGSAAGMPPRTLYVTPHAGTGTAHDFVPGDPIEQAIGADPFHPQAMRFIAIDAVPSSWPSGFIDCYNRSWLSRSYGIKFRGRPETIEDCDAKMYDRSPAFGAALSIQCATGVGLDCQKDFADAAILFRQPNHEQPIKWHYGHEEGKPPREATLTVSKETGTLTYQGGGARFDGSVTAAGLSSSDTPARNLCGKDLVVPKGATELAVPFPTAEADGDYAVFVEQTWLCNRAIRETTATGFKVVFDKPAPEGATLDWMLVR